MVHAELLQQDGILVIVPETSLSEQDFRSIAATVDPYIEANGKLRGILIHAKQFPGWHDFASLVAHFKFIRDHHQSVAKVAAVSDSKFLEIAPKIASHFVSAEVTQFPENELDAAMEWLKTEA